MNQDSDLGQVISVFINDTSHVIEMDRIRLKSTDLTDEDLEEKGYSLF